MSTTEVAQKRRPPPRMVRPLDIFTEAEYLELRSKSDLMAVWLFIANWGIVFAAMAFFAAWPNPLSFVIAAMIIGARQLGFAVLMHDGSHGLLFNNIKVNDFVTQWLAAMPIATDIRPYRPYHLTHHRYTQQDEDPDLILSAPFPTTKSSFRRKAIRDLTGQTAFKQRRSQLRAALGKPEWKLAQRITHFWDKLGGFVVTNVILLAGLAALGHWYLYPLLWLVPLMTWYQFITRIRNIAEHALVPDNNDQWRNARTTEANWLERLLIAPNFVNYHVEHHLFIWLPAYKQPRVHKMLIERGYGEKMETAKGYWDILSRAFSRPEGQSGGGDGGEKRKGIDKPMFEAPTTA